MAKICPEQRMENAITLSNLNDFIFCPLSIYYHNVYGNQERIIFQSQKQLDGTNVHKSVDSANYSSDKNVLQGIDVYCEKYGIVGKTDCFDLTKGLLIERKKKVAKIYDGYVFQVYAQYYALTEMGYEVKKIIIHSYDDNKNYDIPLPNENEYMKVHFEDLIAEIRNFDPINYVPSNISKCMNCIYSDLCGESLY